MQDTKANKPSNEKKIKSILPLSALFKNIKKFFLIWLIVSLASVIVIDGFHFANEMINRKISVTVNFSFDGIESGHDPTGNKFDVNEIKSISAIKNTLDELDLEYTNEDAEKIYSNINISGDVPSDVINRITAYSSIYDTDGSNESLTISDTTYYPTQYTITMNCDDVNISFGECAEFLNNLTERYSQTFLSNYGYKKSLENAVTVIDYNDYDYIEAVSVIDSSLVSLQNYINELASKDESRFRSEKSGYTFSDLSNSIETIRTEDLDMISSYITVYNLTKDKENLISNYNFKIEDLSRQKAIYEQQIKTLNETLDEYEKNSILIFANATSGANATINQSTDTYDNLIDEQVNVQKELSDCEQQIDKFSKRIKALESSTKTGSTEKIQKYFENMNDKLTILIDSVNVTASEYYNDVTLKNAYTILSSASDSIFSIFKSSVKDSLIFILSFEFIISGLYILMCTAAVNNKIHDIILLKFKRNKKSNKNNKNKPSKKQNKK